MANNLTVAWGIPVEPVALGASIETYATSKATAAAFEEHIQTCPSGSAIRQIPPELIEMIKKHVRKLAYDEHEEEWKTAKACYCGDCSLSDHISEKEYAYRRKKFMDDEQLTESDLEDPDGEDDDFRLMAHGFNSWLRDRRVGVDSQEHLENIGIMEDKIGHGAGTFKEAKKLFKKDFGLEIHFQTNNWEPEYRDSQMIEPFDFDNKTLTAFLILPGQYTPFRLATISDLTAWNAMMFINDSVRQQPSEERKALFKTAMDALALKLNTRGMWTLGRPTSEKYSMSRGTLRSIESAVAYDYPGESSKDCQERSQETHKRIDALKWPQLMVLASGSHRVVR